MSEWLSYTGLMLLTFPLLFAALLLFVHIVVQFVPCTIREHRVSYRRIQTHVADFLLILRLALGRN